MGWASGFSAGSQLGRSVVDTYRQSQDDKDRELRKKEMADIAGAQGTEVYTAEQAAQLEAAAKAIGPDGKPYYTVGNDAAGKYTLTPNFQNETGATPTDYAPATVAAKGVNFLGKNYDAPLTETQATGARIQAMAGVMERSGDAEGAMRYRHQAKQGDLTDMQMAQAKRTGKLADQEDADKLALRAAMAAGGLGSGAGLPNAQASPVGVGDPLTTTGKQSPQGDLHNYLNNVAPGVVKTLLSQGKTEEAKRFNDFAESEQGKAYATAWVTGLRQHAMGDHAGAIKSFEKLYNEQIHDGRTVQIKPIGDGKQYQMQMFDGQGQNIGSRTLDPATLASQSALLLEPTRAVEFHAQQQGKREAEKATLDRQLQIEEIRQKTTEIREDHRDERLLTRLKATPQRGGLTAAQQRSNFEIDDAREQVSNMDATEIRRRTAKQTDTGRENPDYDPTLARASNLANRRKVGEDPAFDTRQGESGQQAPGQGVDRQDVAKRFRSDTNMHSNRLGKDTPNGTEVLDRSGKVIGHYR